MNASAYRISPSILPQGHLLRVVPRPFGDGTWKLVPLTFDTKAVEHVGQCIAECCVTDESS